MGSCGVKVFAQGKCCQIDVELRDVDVDASSVFCDIQHVKPGVCIFEVVSKSKMTGPDHGILGCDEI